MPKLYLENEKTKNRYEIVSLDKENGKVTLRSGDTTFDEVYNPEAFKRMGYKLIKVAAEG